jgi:non-canonical (house-cleaning) NTP pyrophosphatase
MKIVLASTSAVKIDACRKAFGAAADITGVKVPSCVNEQPMDTETLQGAFNRIAAARAAMPGADVYVSIENGIFEENGKYIDRPVIAVAKGAGAPEVTYGDGVEFPAASVEETRKRGFDTWTVGKVMQEQGIVAQHDDPHLTLSGKSRADYLAEAVVKAAAKLSL